MFKIRQSRTSDEADIKKIHMAAFGEEGPEIAKLVAGLFKDSTAFPMLSLVAEDGNRLTGHILFTKVDIHPIEKPVSARILAPLAILPDVQNKGIGQKLINEGLNVLTQSNVALVFVLGHPWYYPRCGFEPAGEKGFAAPYPIPKENAPAWMVQQLNGDMIGKVKGTVRCARVLNQPEPLSL